MSIPLPNLDDRTYEELVAQARSRISSECSDWTNHNQSDPGMMLIELTAWLTELLLYRINQIPDRNTKQFLKLLNQSDWELSDATQEALQLEIRNTILRLRHRYRAVSAEDFEHLTLNDWHTSQAAQTLGNDAKIARTKCLSDRNLASSDPTVKAAIAPGNISLVIVPAQSTVNPPLPTPQLIAQLWNWLNERRLLTVRHHVVAPDYVPIQIRAQLFLEEGVLLPPIEEKAKLQLQQFFDPLRGSVDGKGWQFGRDVHLSEVYDLLERIPGVNHIRDIVLQNTPTQVSIAIADHQLVNLQQVTLELYERFGDTWESKNDATINTFQRQGDIWQLSNA